MGEFSAARHEFDIRAKAYGIDPSKHHVGAGWKDPRAQVAWYFFYSAWQRRHSWDKKRAAVQPPAVLP